MKLLNKENPNHWVSIVAAPDGITLAEVAQEAAKPTLVRCEVLTGSMDAAALKTLSHQWQLKRKNTVLVLDEAQYQLMMTNAPDVPAAELKQALKWAVKDRLDFSVDEATLDILPLPNASSGGALVYVAVARNETILRHMLDWEKAAGKHLNAIDIAETAQRNLANLIDRSEKGLALLSFQPSGGLLTFTAQGELFHARQIEVNLSMLDTDDEERLSHLFDRIALEVQRSLDAFERQFPRIAVNRLVLAPCPARAAMRDFLQPYLGITVDSFDLKDIVEISAVAGLETLEQQARVLGAIGGALRDGGAL